MAMHLKRHHQISVKKTTSKSHKLASQQLKQYYHKVEANSDTTKLDTEILKKYFFQVVIIEALVILIVVRNLSFCIVEWAEFHTLCQALNKECKGMITTTHSQVKERVREAWAKHKNVVRRVLQSAISCIHISLDIWISPN
jgi:midasin (ATPase involved in ribosome maturation)